MKLLYIVTHPRQAAQTLVFVFGAIWCDDCFLDKKKRMHLCNKHYEKATPVQRRATEIHNDQQI